MTKQNKGYKDPEVLRRLYWVEDMPLWEIADRFDVHQKTIWRQFEKHGIERYGRGEHNRGGPRQKYCTYRTKNGYPRWCGNPKYDDFNTTFVHQLLAVANGADPYKVYDGWKHHIHHKNGVKWDNRPSNIELLTAEEHAREHERGSDKEYTDEELLSWIDAFAKEVGKVPTRREMDDCPGPHSMTFINRFGSWTDALEMCGLEPRDGGDAAKYGYRASEVGESGNEDGEGSEP